MSIETNTDLSLEGTESRHRYLQEWRPRGTTFEIEVRQVIIWEGDKFATAQIKEALINNN